MRKSAAGWVYLGPYAANADLVEAFRSAGQAETVLDAPKNLRTDYPRFPFYRKGDLVAVLPEGATLKVRDIRAKVGADSQTWAEVECSWEEPLPSSP